jgi:hypothetical protein
MSVATLDYGYAGSLSSDTYIEWWDEATDCTLVVAAPCADHRLWAEYLAGARESYGKHGVACALELDSLCDPTKTSLFLAAVDGSGRVVAGVRAKGPFSTPGESHALVEWSGRPGLAAVSKMISDRIPFGVVEVKTAWTRDDPGRSRLLTSVLARFPLHSTMLLNSQFAMATSAAHVLARWRTSGGVVASKIPPTPYPDERYQTEMMWWNRSTFFNYAQHKQVSTTLEEFRLFDDYLSRQDQFSLSAR